MVQFPILPGGITIGICTGTSTKGRVTIHHQAELLEDAGILEVTGGHRRTLEDTGILEVTGGRWDTGGYWRTLAEVTLAYRSLHTGGGCLERPRDEKVA